MNFRGVLYPFKWSYWRGQPANRDRGMTTIGNLARRVSINSETNEQEPIDKQLGIQLHNVSKVSVNIQTTSSFSLISSRLTHFYSIVVHRYMLYVMSV